MLFGTEMITVYVRDFCLFSLFPQCFKNPKKVSLSRTVPKRSRRRTENTVEPQMLRVMANKLAKKWNAAFTNL